MRGENWSFSFPIVTCIVISIVLTVLANLYLGFFRRQEDVETFPLAAFDAGRFHWSSVPLWLGPIVAVGSKSKPHRIRQQCKPFGTGIFPDARMGVWHKLFGSGALVWNNSWAKRRGVLPMAAYVTWRDYYSVNDPFLDAEHKQIIEYINELYSALQDPTQGELTKRVLDKLVRYTETHFKHEEERMKEAGFPQFEAHKVLHDNMKRRTVALRTHVTLVTARDVLVFLKEWFLEHVQGEDKLYSSYMPRLASSTKRPPMSLVLGREV
jgi:hemerythrin-like metal-binding protein